MCIDLSNKSAEFLASAKKVPELMPDWHQTLYAIKVNPKIFGQELNPKRHWWRLGDIVWATSHLKKNPPAAVIVGQTKDGLIKLHCTNSQITGKKSFDLLRNANDIEYNYEVQMAFSPDGTKVFYNPRLEFIENLRVSMHKAEETNAELRHLAHQLEFKIRLLRNVVTLSKDTNLMAMARTVVENPEVYYDEDGNFHLPKIPQLVYKNLEYDSDQSIPDLVNTDTEVVIPEMD